MSATRKFRAISFKLFPQNKSVCKQNTNSQEEKSNKPLRCATADYDQTTAQ